MRSFRYLNDKQAIFSALFLDKETKKVILNKLKERNVSPAFSNLCLDHLILEFKPNLDDLEAQKFGKSYLIKIVGYCLGEGIDCLVASPCDIESKNPYITLSKKKNIQSEKLNEILRSEKIFDFPTIEVYGWAGFYYN